MDKQKKRSRNWTARTAYTQYVSFRLPIDQYERLKKICDEYDCTVTAFTHLALERYMDEIEEGGQAVFL